ncbi:hypothetical protein MauCBS54593_005917 [Microsporum audouinii]
MIEEIIQKLSLGGGFLWPLVIIVLFYVGYDLYTDYKVSRLGAFAPRIKTYLPLSADFIAKGFSAAKKHRDLEFFTSIFETTPSLWGGSIATAELKVRPHARNIFTADPENIKAVLTSQFSDYGKGWRFHKEWKDFLGDSIFATDGELWSRSRHLIRPIFAKERFVDTEIFEKHIEKLIPQLATNENGGSIVDVGPLFFRFTLDAATDYLLGKSVDSLDDPKTSFAESFQYVLHKQSVLFRAGPLRKFFSEREFKANIRKMNDFLQQFINQVLALTPEELDSKLSKQDTFLHALARFTRDPVVLRDQLVAILLAGRDTTAATLAFAMFELSRHPETVKKARAEIFATCGTNKPTYGDLKAMKYVNAVINETMRLYPVVPFNVRHAVVDTTLPRGGGLDGKSPIGVPADTRILYSTMAMQRRRDLYDPPPSASSSPEEKAKPWYDPHEFHPERWTSGWQPKPWHFIPFNGGPRICLGQQFATIEMGYTITRILQHYSEITGIGCPPPGTDPILKTDVTLSPGEEFNCVFRREGAE